MMMKAAIALLVLFIGLMMPMAAAQTGPEPDDMEDNAWRVLLKNFDDGRLSYLFGTDRHRTVRTATELALLAPSYESHLGLHTYPNPNGTNLSSTYCSGFSRSNLNELISLATDATAWAIRNGFKSNRSLFNIVPKYDPAGTALGGWVNLIVCDARRENVAFITNNQDAEQSNILTVGSGYVKVMSHPIGKMVIPHELAHVYQLNFMPYVRRELDEGDAIKTIREGLADAIGLRIVFENFGTGGSLEAKQRSYLSQSGVKGFKDEHSRRMFMMRPYNLPLQLNEGSSKTLAAAATNSKGRRLINSVDAVMQKRMSYFTSGFFYHIMERYLDRPGQIHDLYRRFTRTEDTLNIYPNLDAFLKSKSKVKTEGPVLGLVFAQFLTEYAEWGEFRTAGNIKTPKWLRASFGGCPTISISNSVKERFAETDFTPFAGGCFEIVIEPEIAQKHPELELFVTSKDGDPDRIYMGMARIEQAGRLNYSCYERAKLRAVRGTFPCLLNPAQGDTGKVLPSLAGKKVRTFHVPPFDIAQNKARQMIRIILADVPDDLSGGADVAKKAEAATYRLTVGVDSAHVEGEDVPDPTGNTEQAPGPRSDANRNLRAARPPRLSRADGPLTPNGTQSVFNADARAILNGDTRLPISENLRDADGVGQLVFSLETSTDKVDGPELGFIARQDYFGTGDIGTFNVQAVYGFGEKLGLQDPDKPSEMEITQNDPEALIYEVELNVCAYSAAQLTTHAMSGKPFDPCKDGKRLTYKVENSVAFPALLPGLASQTGAFEAGEESQALKDYQNVRLARLGLPQAINVAYDGGKDGAQSPGDNSPGNNAPGSGSGSGPAPGAATACSIRDPGGSCDCSCDAKVCLETKQAGGVASASDTSCRLTCGKKWNTCTP